MRSRSVVFAALLLVMQSGAALADRPSRPIDEAMGAWRQSGIASFYGVWHEGRLQANGRPYHRFASTAAHRTLPFGTIARVTDLRTGRSERVRIEDRGPYVGGWIIDLSQGTARRLGLEERGVGPVAITVEPGDMGPR